jgi:spore coat protein U-like protein
MKPRAKNDFDGTWSRFGTRRTALVAVLSACCGFFAEIGAADAGTAPGTLSISITINAACSVSAGSSIAFSAISSTVTAAQTASGTITVTCTNLSPYSVSLDNGGNYTTTRQMANGSNYIGYGLYLDGSDTNAWGATTAAGSCTGGANTCSLGTGNGSAQNIPVYAKIPTLAGPPAGSYTDTVNITVAY